MSWLTSILALVIVMIGPSLSSFSEDAIVPNKTAAASSKVTAIKAGRILTITRGEIERGVILIESGKIKAVGAESEIPPDAKVVDAGKGVVMPGIIDGNAVLGTTGGSNEASSEVTPSFRISEAINPQSKDFKRVRRFGITTAYVTPGTANVIGGLGAVIKTVGKTVDEMLVKDAAALKLCLGADPTRGNRPPRGATPTTFYYRRPTTRMGVVWMLRESFFDARALVAPLEANSKPEEDPGASLPMKTGEISLSRNDVEILARALRKQLPVRVTARKKTDIMTAFEIADEFGLRIVLDECTEGYKVVEEIARRGVPVVVGPLYYYPTTGSQWSEGREVALNNAGILANAGVKIAITANASLDTIKLPTFAAFAVRHGMKRDDALRAITINAAEIIGVADRVGSIEVGKDADLVVFSGDPLDVTSRVEKVFVNGEEIGDDGGTAF